MKKIILLLLFLFINLSAHSQLYINGEPMPEEPYLVFRLTIKKYFLQKESQSFFPDEYITDNQNDRIRFNSIQEILNYFVQRDYELKDLTITDESGYRLIIFRKREELHKL